MDLRVDPVSLEKTRQDDGVGRRHPFAVEIADPVVRVGFRAGERNAAFAESELVGDFYVEPFLFHFVETDDPDVGDAHRNGLRNVVVAQVQHFERKIVAARQQLAFAFFDRYARFGEQFHAPFVESAFGLNGNS